MNDSELNDSITSDIFINHNQTTKKYLHHDKKQLVKRMNDVKNKKCYIKIFKLIHTSTKYTVNDNGVLFNLTILPDNILTQIETIIEYYENKKSVNNLHLKNFINTPEDIDDNMSSSSINYFENKN